MSTLRILAAPQSLINWLGFIGMITVNAMANGLPINGKTTGELSDMYPNLFVPAGITFSIWGVIYLALLAFCVYQSPASLHKPLDAQRMAVRAKIGGAFFLSCLLNLFWILAWHYLRVGLSVMIMLALFATLLYIHLRLPILFPANGHAYTKWAVLVPFSLYLGWISIALIANITALLVHLNWNGWGLEPQVWTMLLIGAGCLVALYMLQTRGNWPHVLVALWAFFGIFLKQSALSPEDRRVSFTALAAMGLLFMALVTILLRNGKKKRISA